MTDRLIVIGGTAAGLSAATKAKRLDPSIEVRVFERSSFVSYGSCGLPYYIGGLIREENELVSLTVQELAEKRDISVEVCHEVTRIDRAAKVVEVRGLRKEASKMVPYDKLVIATGARAFCPPIEGLRSEGLLVPGAYTLRQVEDGKALKAAAEKAESAVVIGGGLIGLELAEQLRGRRLKVEIVESFGRLLPVLPEPYSQALLSALIDKGVEVRLSATVKEVLHKEGHACGVELEDGAQIFADIVVVAAGAAPETSLAEACGLTLGIKGAIVVKDTQQSVDDASIWACGDCTQTRHVLTGRPFYAPLGTNANKQGRVAGSNIVGHEEHFPGVLGSQAIKVFNLYAAVTGLNLRQACEAGFDAAESSIVKGDRASYYPGGEDNHLNLVFERKGGRILGAQGIGSFSVAGRINTLVAAITAGMSVGQLNGLDLLYTPAIAPVYDPLLIAAGGAVKKVKGGK
jgi:NADPH-dependent 2,4-dienoyl-CoA reductase/sulfur reductase-like enzyme